MIATAAVPESVFEHAPLETETKLSVCAVVAAVTVTVAVPAAIVAVVLEPPFKLYVTTLPVVPVIVNTALAPLQIAAAFAATVATICGPSVITIAAVEF